jgi:hypothetical protein
MKGMPEEPKQIGWHPPQLLADDWADAESEELKLKASLEFRRRFERNIPETLEDLGTAEHRPNRGLIYDAPLGLKF